MYHSSSPSLSRSLSPNAIHVNMEGAKSYHLVSNLNKIGFYLATETIFFNILYQWGNKVIGKLYKNLNSHTELDNFSVTVIKYMQA